MNSFLRAVRHALRYHWTILGIVLCSLSVAVLWGANLGTVYPFVEVVIQNKSLREGVDEYVKDAEGRIANIQDEIGQAEKSRESAAESDRRRIESRIASMRSELETARQRLGLLHQAQPLVHRYAPAEPFPTLVLVVLALLLGTLAKDLFLVGNMLLVERLALHSTFDLRKLFYRRTLRMNLGSFSHDRTSRYLSHFTHDMQAITSGISTLFGSAILEPLKMIACLIGAAIVCWRLLLLSLIVSPLAILMMNWLSRSVRRTNKRAMEEMSQLYGHLSESLNGIQTVKAFTMERYERNRFHQRAKQYMRRSMRIVTYSALTKPCTELIGIGVICLALLAGGYLVLNQKTVLLGIPMSAEPLSVSDLMVFFALLAGVSDPARKFAEIYNQLQRGTAASERIYAMMDREPTIADPAKPRSLPRPHRELVFDEVQFYYQPEHPVLRDLTLRIPHGETLAVVGPNGCGKTTLMNLIPRFYDPVSGAVRLDDVDLRDVRLSELRQQIGIVTQNTWLFDDTILNNIRYGRPQATDQQVIEAAKQAHAHQFIEQKLSRGYDTVVGQGGQLLSGGQRQRIALARAILRDPAILILDEATSQIDLESEQLIHNALVRFVRDRTAILITHRLSTLSLARRILVLDAGRIVDVGTHEQLLSRCPLYTRLHQIAFRESA